MLSKVFKAHFGARLKGNIKERGTMEKEGGKCGGQMTKVKSN